MKLLKVIIAAAVVAFSLSFASGCMSNGQGNEQGQHQRMGAFNDENYVWESWTYSTNKVDNID